MGSENVDRLSGLPEDIQSLILSLMPTKFAVQTCVLSKRWRYTWMSITNLEFDDQPPLGFSNLETFVDRVLGFCKSSQIDSLRLNFPRILIQGSSVSNWIDKAVTLKVRVLVIRYMFSELPLVSVLPSSIFTCRTLTKLEICLRNIWECPFVVSLPCLRTLYVMDLYNSLANAFKLIAGAPILEDLSLHISRHDSNEDYKFDIPTLKRLELYSLFSFSSHFNKLVLRVPKLEHLFFKGELNSLFVMEDVSSLVEVFVDLFGQISASLQAELLKGISGVKLLSLTKLNTESQDSSLLKIISASPLQAFPNMERLELIGFWNFELILKFLESSPELKEIYIRQLQGSRWIAPKLVPACMLAKLTTIKLMNFKWRKSNILFLKFLLRNAKVLKTLTVSLEKSSKEEETRLLNLPRASSCCEIQIYRS